MDELPSSFLFLANPNGFEGVILVIFPSQRERLTSRGHAENNCGEYSG